MPLTRSQSKIKKVRFAEKPEIRYFTVEPNTTTQTTQVKSSTAHIGQALLSGYTYEPFSVKTGDCDWYDNLTAYNAAEDKEAGLEFNQTNVEQMESMLKAMQMHSIKKIFIKDEAAASAFISLNSKLDFLAKSKIQFVYIDFASEVIKELNKAIKAANRTIKVEFKDYHAAAKFAYSPVKEEQKIKPSVTAKKNHEPLVIGDDDLSSMESEFSKLTLASKQSKQVVKTYKRK